MRWDPGNHKLMDLQASGIVFSALVFSLVSAGFGKTEQLIPSTNLLSVQKVCQEAKKLLALSR